MIEYRNTKEFDREELQRLFLSVSWSSGDYPDKLMLALRNYGCVFSAWDGGKLVGLMAAMDDNIMTAYIHYLLVDPEYQGQHIGRKLMEMTKEHYTDYLRIVLNSYSQSIGFYKSLGFREGHGEVPMFLTSLWD